MERSKLHTALTMKDLYQMGCVKYGSRTKTREGIANVSEQARAQPGATWAKRAWGGVAVVLLYGVMWARGS